MRYAYSHSTSEIAKKQLSVALVESARHDCKVADLCYNNVYYRHASFYALLACEKILKSFISFLGGDFYYTHSLHFLAKNILSLNLTKQTLNSIIDSIRTLLPTFSSRDLARYNPLNYDEIVGNRIIYTDDTWGNEDAQQCIILARKMLSISCDFSLFCEKNEIADKIGPLIKWSKVKVPMKKHYDLDTIRNDVYKLLEYRYATKVCFQFVSKANNTILLEVQFDLQYPDKRTSFAGETESLIEPLTTSKVPRKIAWWSDLKLGFFPSTQFRSLEDIDRLAWKYNNLNCSWDDDPDATYTGGSWNEEPLLYTPSYTIVNRIFFSNVLFR